MSFRFLRCIDIFSRKFILIMFIVIEIKIIEIFLKLLIFRISFKNYKERKGERFNCGIGKISE